MPGPSADIPCPDAAQPPGPTPTPEPPPSPPAPSLRVTLDVRQSGRSANYTIASTAQGHVRYELALDGRVLHTAPGTYTVSIKTKGAHVVTATAWNAAGGSLQETRTVRR